MTMDTIEQTERTIAPLLANKREHDAQMKQVQEYDDIVSSSSSATAAASVNQPSAEMIQSMASAIIADKENDDNDTRKNTIDEIAMMNLHQ